MPPKVSLLANTLGARILELERNYGMLRERMDASRSQTLEAGGIPAEHHGAIAKVMDNLIKEIKEESRKGIRFLQEK